ncbi:MAG TPA: hypothetical protein VF109_09870 [Mycobacteriales bacterium]
MSSAGVNELLEAAVATGVECDLRDVPDAEVRAEVVRDLLLTGSGARGLRLRGARLTGRLDLEGRRIGELRLLDCELVEQPWLRGASLPLVDLRRCLLPAGLSLTETTIERVLLLDHVRAGRWIALDGARLGGACSLRNARLTCPDGPALVADRVRVDGELRLDDLVAQGTGPQGVLSLVGARIDGRLSGRRLVATNPAGPAIVADNLQVTDTIDLSKGSRITGTGERGAMRIVGARASSLSLGGAELTNPAGWALAAHYLGLVGTLYLDRMVATGGLRMSGSRIGGQVDLTGSTVDGGAGSALAGTRLQVSQAVVLDDAVLHSTGERATVDLRSARVAGDVELRRTRLSHPGGIALRLNTAVVEGRVILDQVAVQQGGVDLRDSTIGTLHDDPATMLPAQDGWVELGGLTYRGVPGRLGVTAGERIAWLARMPQYEAQPYRQLAAAYQAAGHPDDARRVLVAQQRHLRRSGALTGWSVLRHRLSGVLLQYGYQPFRAVGLLALTLLAAAVLFLGLAGGTTAGGGAVAAAGPCPAVDRVGLAIDTAVPLATTGAAERCALATGTASGRTLAIAGWALTLLGWASATLVVAGYTGLVRRS